MIFLMTTDDVPADLPSHSCKSLANLGPQYLSVLSWCVGHCRVLPPKMDENGIVPHKISIVKRCKTATKSLVGCFVSIHLHLIS